MQEINPDIEPIREGRSPEPGHNYDKLENFQRRVGDSGPKAGPTGNIENRPINPAAWAALGHPIETNTDASAPARTEPALPPEKTPEKTPAKTDTPSTTTSQVEKVSAGHNHVIPDTDGSVTVKVPPIDREAASTEQNKASTDIPPAYPEENETGDGKTKQNIVDVLSQNLSPEELKEFIGNTKGKTLAETYHIAEGIPGADTEKMKTEIGKTMGIDPLDKGSDHGANAEASPSTKGLGSTPAVDSPSGDLQKPYSLKFRMHSAQDNNTAESSSDRAATTSEGVDTSDIPDGFEKTITDPMMGSAFEWKDGRWVAPEGVEAFDNVASHQGAGESLAYLLNQNATGINGSSIPDGFAYQFEDGKLVIAPKKN